MVNWASGLLVVVCVAYFTIYFSPQTVIAKTYDLHFFYRWKTKMASCARRAATTSACETLLVPRIVIAAMLLSISDPDFYPDSAPEYGNPALDIQSRSRFQPRSPNTPSIWEGQGTPHIFQSLIVPAWRLSSGMTPLATSWTFSLPCCRRVEHINMPEKDPCAHTGNAKDIGMT